MPLDPKSITRASRIMLPAHAIFSLGLGLTYWLQSPARTSPALQSLGQFWTIDVTGISLAVGGALLMTVYVLGRRELIAALLAGGVVAYLGVAVLFAIGVLMSPTAPFSSPWWPMYGATCHLASLVSVVFEEKPNTGGVAT